jgi:hypothetical protein
VRDGFEMGTPDAVLDLAEVIYFHVWRDVTEGEAMGISDAIPIPEMPVALGVEGTDPEPTVVHFGMKRGDGAVLIDVLPEPNFGRSDDVNAWHIKSLRPQLYNGGRGEW